MVTIIIFQSLKIKILNYTLLVLLNLKLPLCSHFEQPTERGHCINRTKSQRVTVYCIPTRYGLLGGISFKVSGTFWKGKITYFNFKPKFLVLALTADVKSERTSCLLHRSSCQHHIKLQNGLGIPCDQIRYTVSQTIWPQEVC